MLKTRPVLFYIELTVCTFHDSVRYMVKQVYNVHILYQRKKYELIDIESIHK